MAKATDIFNPLEEDEQAALIDWAAAMSNTIPDLAMLYAIPNGGYRSKKTARTLKRTGVKPGVPDLCLAVPRGGSHALYIEMKRRKGGRIQQDQLDWMDRLTHQGYTCAVCKGWDAARDVILDYLNQ